MKSDHCPIRVLKRAVFDPEGDLILRVLERGIRKNNPTIHDQPGDAPAVAHYTVVKTALKNNLVIAVDNQDDLSLGQRNNAEIVAEIHMLVSSKHLERASPVFKRLISHARETTSQRTIHLDLPEADPLALQVILCAIHGRLMTNLHPYLLLRVALLVEEYELHGALSTYIGTWLECIVLRTEPQAFSKPLYSPVWLIISWIFGIESAFIAASRRLQFQVRGDDGSVAALFKEYGWWNMSRKLGMGDVLEEIDRTRIQAINQASKQWRHTIKRFQASVRHEGPYVCPNRTPGCDKKVFRHLLLIARNRDIDMKADPTKGGSFEDWAKFLREHEDLLEREYGSDRFNLCSRLRLHSHPSLPPDEGIDAHIISGDRPMGLELGDFKDLVVPVVPVVWEIPRLDNTYLDEGI